MRRLFTTVPSRAVLALVAGGLALAGCGASSSATGTPANSSSAASSSAASSSTASSSTASTPAASTPALAGSITVFAAASLTDAFGTLGKQFQAAHPGTTVTFSFAASSALATQITQGAPADVFASASAKTMDTVVAAKAADAPVPFAKNVMEIAVPPANPAKITSLTDLGKPGVKVALCQVAVPCGSTAAKVFANAKLTVTPVTQEADVKATLTKVELGEVDAGVVYVTDVLAAGAKVKGIEIPAALNASTSYPIAGLTATRNPALAKAFVDYVLSSAGAAVLTSAGFLQP